MLGLGWCYVLLVCIQIALVVQGRERGTYSCATAKISPSFMGYRALETPAPTSCTLTSSFNPLPSSPLLVESAVSEPDNVLFPCPLLLLPSEQYSTPEDRSRVSPPGRSPQVFLVEAMARLCAGSLLVSLVVRESV